jgi:hypothetical protein
VGVGLPRRCVCNREAGGMEHGWRVTWKKKEGRGGEEKRGRRWR